MTGPKTNEGATEVGERVGTRARVRYVRASATKARAVLDLIRGKDVNSADAILQFTERDMARVVRKCLASAVANAQNNEGEDPDELKVVACYADEGPTLRRFRPRARGRATRIRKRTCHITIIVGRMTDDELEQRRRREEAAEATGRRGRATSRAATSRRERVARSRQAAAAAKGQTVEEPADETLDETTEEPAAEALDETVVEDVDEAAVEETAPEAGDDAVAEAEPVEEPADEEKGDA